MVHSCELCGTNFNTLIGIQAHNASHRIGIIQPDGSCNDHYIDNDAPLLPTFSKYHANDSDLLNDKDDLERVIESEKRPDVQEKCTKVFFNRGKVNLLKCKRKSTDSNCESLSRSLPFCCEICGKRFLKLGYLRLHEPIHSKAKVKTKTKTDECKEEVGQYECNECGKLFSSDIRLRRHAVCHLTENMHHECKVCHKRFASQHHLNMHSVTHLSARSHACPICGKLFYLESHVQSHIVVHSRERTESTKNRVNKKKSPAAKLCTKVEQSNGNCTAVSSSTLVSDNEQNSTGVGNEPQANELHSLNPNDTDQNTIRSYSLLSDSVNEQCESSPCELIETVTNSLQHTDYTASITDTSPLVSVSNNVSDNSDSCSVTSTSTNHPPLRYECPTCGKRYPYPSTLNQHMLSHSGTRSHMCQYCGKGFILAGQLKMHMRVHTGERPYVCVKCGHSFSFKGCLTKHMQIHNRAQHFECNICASIFKSQASLDRHVKDHAEPHSSFQCDVCFEKFIHPGLLEEHKEIHVKYTEDDSVNENKQDILTHMSLVQDNRQSHSLSFDSNCNGTNDNHLNKENAKDRPIMNEEEETTVVLPGEWEGGEGVEMKLETDADGNLIMVISDPGGSNNGYNTNEEEVDFTKEPDSWNRAAWM